LRANLPRSIPAMTVQRNCGSGLEAITSAAERIRAGRAQVIVAAAVESGVDRLRGFFLCRRFCRFGPDVGLEHLSDGPAAGGYISLRGCIQPWQADELSAELLADRQ
ncbi:MAG: hypothetical protein IIB61_05055, partial [Planctomycetes bacterium]|nr:hypothetical protein [Planctomycetota bacterium]